MSLSNITEKIQSDARLEAEELLSKAQKQAEEILSSAQASAEAEAAVIRKKAEAEQEGHVQRLIAAERTQMKKDLLGEKQKIIGQVLEEALRHFETMDDGAYEAYITDLLLSSVTEGNEEIIMEEAYKKKLPAGYLVKIGAKLALSGKKPLLHFSQDSPAIGPGLILRRGKVMQDLTVRRQLKLMESELRGETAKILF
jgi:V/A-type H+-transporting ATPase subunit E